MVAPRGQPPLCGKRSSPSNGARPRAGTQRGLTRNHPDAEEILKGPDTPGARVGAISGTAVERSHGGNRIAAARRRATGVRASSGRGDKVETCSFRPAARSQGACAGAERFQLPRRTQSSTARRPGRLRGATRSSRSRSCVSTSTERRSRAACGSSGRDPPDSGSVAADRASSRSFGGGTPSAPWAPEDDVAGARARGWRTRFAGYLSRMFSGKTPVNVQHAERIARVLGLPVVYFPEVRVREAAVVAAVRKSARLRGSIYLERVRRNRQRD